MAYFKIEEPGHAVKYIKDIDRANGTLEFSESKAGCFQQDSGFFADSELAYLKFHFTEAYPELKYMTIDNNWGHRYVVEEAPQQINQVNEDVGVAANYVDAPAVDLGPWD